MYEKNTKADKGKMDVYYIKMLIKYMKWCNMKWKHSITRYLQNI